MKNEPIVVFPLKLNLHLKEAYLKDIVNLWDISHSGFKSKKSDNKEYCIGIISTYLNGLVQKHNCLKGVVVKKDDKAYLVPAGPLGLTENNKNDPGVDVIALQRRCKDIVEQKKHSNSIDIEPVDPILSEALKTLRNSSGENIPHWPVIFSSKMDEELRIDEDKIPVEPEKHQEVEVLTNNIETVENKPKLTITSFKPEITTSDAWINDSVFICDLLGLTHPISTILKPPKANYPKMKNFEPKTISFEGISSRANSEDNILQNSVNKQSISYLRELCVIELSRLKIPNFENFLNTQNEEQLIEFHEMIRKIKKKNKSSCLIM